MKTLQRKISNATQIINTLSYTSTDAKHLQTMLDKLEVLIKVSKADLPSSEGLTLRPLSLLKRTRQIKQKYKNLSKRASTYSALESHPHSKPGRKRADFRYRNRVGRKAQHLRKVQVLFCLFVTIHVPCTPYRKQNHRNTRTLHPSH